MRLCTYAAVAPVTLQVTPPGFPGWSKHQHAATNRGLRYCGHIVLRFNDDWVTLRCPDLTMLLRVPRPMGSLDNSAISILDGLGRTWQQFAARRAGGWHITQRANER